MSISIYLLAINNICRAHTKQHTDMSFCHNCGAPLREDAKFCANCGKPIAEQALPEQPAQPVQPEPPVQPEQPVQAAQPPAQRPPKKKSKAGIAGGGFEYATYSGLKR
jgi:hypothetical protein